MEIREYVRKPFVVEAVQVTEENMQEVAKWCGGGVYHGTYDYIKVNVRNPATPRQGRAFVGDWILSSKRGFKVYNNAAFEKSFSEHVDESSVEGLYKKALDTMELLKDVGASTVSIANNVMESCTFAPLYHDDDAVTLNIPKGERATLAKGHVLYRINLYDYVITKDEKIISKFRYSPPGDLAHLVTRGAPPMDIEWDASLKGEFISVSEARKNIGFDADYHR